MNFSILLIILLLPFSSLFGEEKVLMEKPVPNRILRQGDIRILRNGDQVGLRIDLHTKHLDKIQKKILESEEANWPVSPDSQRYVKHLNEACEIALEAENKKVTFVIEWMLHPDGTGRVSLINAQGRSELNDLSTEYLKRNIAIIMADNFDFTEAEALRWIENQHTLEETP